MDLIWGLPTAATDRWIGALDGVVVDAEARRVTHLIVKRGFLFAKRQQISIDHITRCDHEGVYLNITMFEAFSEKDSAELVQEARPVSLDSKTHIEAMGASLRLKGVRMDSETSCITHLIVRERGEDDLIIPVERITEMSSSNLSLDIRDGETGNFPLYRQDREIAADVWKVLYESEEISDVDLKYVKIDVVDGVVTMQGNMREPSAVTESEVVTALVPGVAGIINHITSDWDIELKIAHLIAKTAPQLSNDVSIQAQLGAVKLYGHVSSEEEKANVLSAIPSVAGMRSVQDNLEVRVPVAVAAEPSAEGRDELSSEEASDSESQELNEEVSGASA